MISEYPLVIYPAKQNTIQPYIIAPILELQDQIILGPDTILLDHSKFINRLERGNELSDDKQAFASVDSDARYVNIYFTFPTLVKEQSGRGGLNLTIGILIDRVIFRRSIICEKLMNFYCYRFSELFDCNLRMNGAEIFLRLLEDKANYQMINEQLSTLFNEMKNGLLQATKKRRLTPLYTFIQTIIRRRQNATFPMMILCKKESSDSNVYMHMIAFLSAIDQYIESNFFYRLKLTTQEGIFNKSVRIIPCLPESLSTILSNISSTDEIIIGNDWIGFKTQKKYWKR